MQDNEKPSPPGPDPTAEQIEKHILAAHEVAKDAVTNGHHPFGAVLVDADNETILMSQGNIDTVNHAESTLAIRAAKEFSPEQLWACTLYSSVEPCVMCAGAMYWANIGRLAYGMSERQLLDYTGAHEENPTMDVSCRYVFAHSQKAIKVWGPVPGVIERIAKLHQDFWQS